MKMEPSDDLRNYYARRASEYEQVYQRTERQNDLSTLKHLLQGLLADRNTLEIACGTGFWTESVARTATCIFATDINEEVLEIAKSKAYPKGNVEFGRADALTLEGLPEQFTACFAGFWISHIRRLQVRSFLRRVQAKLSPGGRVILVDNRFVAGSNTRIQRTDHQGNTFQIRRLADGTEYEVIKNLQPG